MTAGGLSAEELGAVLGELASSLTGATVRDVARLLSPSRDLFTWSDGEGLRLEG